MGCKLSQLATSEFSNDPFDRPPPPSDPRSPLTAKQQYCILASWKGVFRQIEKTGIILFVKLFEENEELLHLFEKFRELRTKEAIVSSAELAEHATQVMHTLDEGIKGLSDMDSFFSYVRHVGGTHRQVPGFKAENFMKIEQPFLEAAKITLGERYTPNIENIYKVTIRFILENLVKGYEDAGQPNGTTETLFEENEELLHLFEKFRELRTKEAIVSSAELAEHATQVMHTLDEGIKGLSDMDSFFSYVRHVGGTHRQVPGFKAENFMKIEQPFLEAAKITLGERYTPNIENIYKVTIRFILENLVKGYEDAGQPNGTTET